MKVACPHCNVAYSIDDRKVPATGLNVRCPKCRNAFPVRRSEAAAVEGAPVPLPAPPSTAAAPPAASPLAQAPVPLPPPPSSAAAPLPLSPVPLPPPPGPDPFAFSPSDFAAPAEPLPSAEASQDEPVAEPFDAQFEEPQFEEAESADLPPPAFDDVPLPDLTLAEPAGSAPGEPAGSLGFGEVDFESSPARVPTEDPFGAPPAVLPPPAAGEELEMLFGEGAGAPGPTGPSPSGAQGYKVRRRSGKIFGPFDPMQVVEMLSKGELMGNEDVSPDGGGTWSAIGSVPAFGDALRKVAADPATSGGGRDVQRAVPYGDRMAGSKVVEGTGEEENDDEPGPRPWKKLLVPAVALLLVLALGAGAGFTKFGFFFVKAFRRVDEARVPALLAEARTALQRGEYPGDRAALDAAARALVADPDSPEAAALHAIVVATLELGHGAPAEALERARRAADQLDTDEKGKLPALAARLAVTLATAPGAATLPQETALEQASAKAPPDADVVALLARAALERGDAPRASALVGRLEAIQPGTPRAGHASGLALLAKRDVAGAKAAFERVLQATPGHLPSRLELAALAEAAGAGEAAQVEAELAPLLAEGADQKLAPAERARALTIRGTLLSREASRSAEADQVLDAAVKADPRLVDARLALARHRLRRGDAQGAVTALEPLAAQAPALPELAALRIRALAAAGRALDASSLADLALRKTPGDPALLLAKAAALEAAGKSDEAKLLFRDAAAREPGAFEPRLALGRLALARGDLADARVELAAAVEKGPREPAVQSVLGELAAAEGDGPAAERAFQAALSLDPEFAAAEIGLAKLAIARGDLAAARARLARALAVDPRNVEGHVTQGTLLWRAKDLPSAERELQAAVDLQPRNALALARLGAVKLEGGDVEAAVARLTAATNEDERLAEASQWLGRALLKKGETPSAIAMLRRAVELEPKNPEHHIHLGAALERSGALPEAVDEYRAAAAADPRHAEAHERLGLLFATNGRFEDAAAAYEKAIGAAPKVTRTRIALADCRAKLGKHDDAIRGYREAMRLDPSAVQVLYKLGRVVHESEGAHAALPWYERAARDDKQNPMPHYYLGYMYKERGQKPKALAAFRRFLELKPDADEKKDIEAEIEDLSGGAR